MRLEIDIPEHHYNNIMTLDSVSLGRVPYKGILMYSINAIKHGKVLEQDPKKDTDSTKMCHDCADYNQEEHYCPKYCDFIRNTMNKNIDAVLENIKTEIKDMADFDNVDLLVKVARAIDKHKAESEINNGNDD